MAHRTWRQRTMSNEALGNGGSEASAAEKNGCGTTLADRRCAPNPRAAMGCPLWHAGTEARDLVVRVAIGESCCADSETGLRKCTR